MKIIRWADALVGDTVGFGIGEAFPVLKMVQEGETVVAFLEGDSIPNRRFASSGEVILVRRAWPEGKTTRDMLDAVDSCAIRVAAILNRGSGQSIYDHLTDQDEPIALLREALDAYELGKPFDSAQGKP